MEGAYNEKYSFLGEWYDNQASLVRRFIIFYYPTDDTLEMYDIKNRKTFVRRIKVNGVNIDNFYIGCTVYILGRVIKIVDYANQHTKNKLEKYLQVTFALIKPIPIKTAGKILTDLHEYGLRVSRMKISRPTAEDINVLFSSMLRDPTYPFLLEYLTGQLVIGLELVGPHAVNLLNKIIGDQDPTKAKPGTIRALYGSDSVRNCIHAAPTQEVALENIEYFFLPPPTNVSRLRLTATLSNCTLCIVKPHAIREGKLGAALEMIDDGGFDVTALNMLIVEDVNAGEFLEVYKGIVPEYKGMVTELSSGLCVAMELVAKDKKLNTAFEFRKLVGPKDPEIARRLRPHTMRAKLGKTKVQNAIHCSDLPEDGLLEVEYFFKILET